MNKTCLIPILAGAGVRQFGHSGMISKLIDSGWRIIVAATIVDDDLTKQMDERIEFIPLISEPLSTNFLRFQKLLDRAFQIKEVKKGKTKWSYRPSKDFTVSQKFRDWIFEAAARVLSTTPKLYLKLLQYETKHEAKQTSRYWLEVLTKYNVDVIVVNTPRSEILHPLLISAQQNNIIRILFYHTKKDISVNGRIIHHFTSIGVWNNWMKQEIIRQNPTIFNPDNIHITGCAHFDCIGRKDILMPEKEFRQKIGANLDSRLLLYPTSVPWVIPDEERYIQLIVEAIENHQLPEDLQIMIRTNPMDLSHHFEEKFDKNQHVIVQRADWRMDKEKGWNFQRYEDMVLYNSLMFYASVCVGIPSTITIEASISCLPVINLGFDLPGLKALRPMKAFWKADFYKTEVKYSAAVLANNETDLLKKINSFLNNKRPGLKEYQAFISEILGVPPHKSAENYIELIKKYAAS